MATHDTDDRRRRVLDGLPVTERYLSLNGLRTAVLEGGDGPPLVLLHGPGAYAAQWRSVLPGLAATHRVVAPDLPGHGASESFAGAPDHDAVCGWLDDLIECTCPVPPVLVGSALGGAFAARYAAERGRRVRALVLLDTLGLAAFQPMPGFASALEEFLATPDSRTHDRLWSECVADFRGLRGQLGGHWDSIKAYTLDRMQAPGRLAAFSTLMTHLGVPAIPPNVLARIAVPTVLIWGRENRASNLQIASDASVRYGWPLRVIDGAAADTALEQPQAFMSALREFLAGLPIARSSA
jgi:pimeloyl-ACP methyl ester carboxylesterase